MGIERMLHSYRFSQAAGLRSTFSNTGSYMIFIDGILWWFASQPYGYAAGINLNIIIIYSDF